MSEYGIVWQTRREARRIAYLERIGNNVRRFRKRYGDTLADLRRQGLDVWVRQEHDEISAKLQRLDQLIAANSMELARDLSFEIGQDIHGLFPRARRNRAGGGSRPPRRGQEETDRQEQEIRQRARQDFIEQMKRDLEDEKESDSRAVQDAVRKLDELKDKLPTMAAGELQDQLIAEANKVDETIADETVRREVVRAIYQSLRKTGFIVEAPQLTGETVLLRARKPAGQQAEFGIKTDGEMLFKFDHYEGQKCRKDIDEVTSLLEECYGIKLDNKKVLWSNPDRIAKGARDNPAGGGTQAGAR